MRLLLVPFLSAIVSHAALGDSRDTIERLTSIFENSTPTLQYTYCENIHDRRGYTFGFAGFTSGTYDGTMFLKEYRLLHPGNTLEKFLPAFERIDAGPHDEDDRNPSTSGLADFPAVFRACGSDPEFIAAQQNLVDRLYWHPSQRRARRIGAKLPLTKGQLYDACINLGEDGLDGLIKATNGAVGRTPKSGQNERTWLAKFLELRLNALVNGEPVERVSADRVRVYQRLLEQGNVRLTLPIRVVCYGDRFALR